MAEFATSLEGDTYEAFLKAAEEIAAETGASQEDVEKSIRKLIYLFITRI